MAMKSKAVFRPASRSPTLRELSLGNKRTEFNDLTWAKACAAKRKFDETPGWRRLMPTLTLSYGIDPHTPATYVDQPDPCAPTAIKRALGEARRRVEEDGAVVASVFGRMQYTAGGDQPGHHAYWDFGRYAREGSAFAGTRRLPARRRTR